MLEPVPEYLKASLTVDGLPLDVPAFEPEVDQLGSYCPLLTQLQRVMKEWLEICCKA